MLYSEQLGTHSVQIHWLRPIENQNQFVSFLPIPVDVVFAVVGVVVVDHKLNIVHIQASEIVKFAKGKSSQVRNLKNLKMNKNLAATSVATRIAVLPVLNSVNTHSLKKKTL